jgi:hypothetical protein
MNQTTRLSVHDKIKRSKLIGWEAKVEGKLQGIVTSSDRGDRGRWSDCRGHWQHCLVIGGWDEVAICLWEAPSDS